MSGRIGNFIPDNMKKGVVAAGKALTPDLNTAKALKSNVKVILFAPATIARIGGSIGKQVFFEGGRTSGGYRNFALLNAALIGAAFTAEAQQEPKETVLADNASKKELNVEATPQADAPKANPTVVVATSVNQKELHSEEVAVLEQPTLPTSKQPAVEAPAAKSEDSNETDTDLYVGFGVVGVAAVVTGFVLKAIVNAVRN